jgi:hypothetical protein
MRTDAWYDLAPAKVRQFKAEALANFAIDLEVIVSIRLRRWTDMVGPGSRCRLISKCELRFEEKLFSKIRS